MILSELRNYLKAQRRVALIDLANHFHMDPDAIRGMLGKWITKGKVRRLNSDAACGSSCCKCDQATLEVYEWTE